MKRLAVLVSNAGTGTNLQAIIDAIEDKLLSARIAVVISSDPDAYGLIRAKKHKLKTEICPDKEKLLSILLKFDPDFICLAGWKKIISEEVLKMFDNKILNIHPGLIPNSLKGSVKNPDGTKGLWNREKMTQKAIQNFLDKKSTYAGSSIHFLSSEFDFGKVLGRCFEKIRKTDDVESLYRRLKIKENKLYVKALQKLCD